MTPEDNKDSNGKPSSPEESDADVSRDGQESNDPQPKKKFHIKTSKYVIGTILFTAIPLIAISGETVKDLFSNWISSCYLVLDQQDVTENSNSPHLLVNINGTGTAPTTIYAMALSHTGIFKSISVHHNIHGNNRALWSSIQPMYQKSDNEEGTDAIAVKIPNYHTNMSLTAKVTFVNNWKSIHSKDDLNELLFVGFEEKDILEGKICRVQNKNFINFLIFQDNEVKLAILIVITGIVGFALLKWKKLVE